MKDKEKKRKRRKNKSSHKSVTGYIIYASEIRKDVIKKHPDKDFGEISKLVGIEWKNLPNEVKMAYEEKAQSQNAKSKALAAEELPIIRANERAILSQQLTQTEPIEWLQPQESKKRLRFSEKFINYLISNDVHQPLKY